ncbi:MAG: hypothetical protein U9R47_04390, partial [Actinomycetota bacterium]|nr:hypothetical protein [Actinomycetota bacterium]
HRSAEIFARAILKRPMTDRHDAHVYGCFEKMTIDADPATPFQADGEHLGFMSHIEITPAIDAMLVVRDPDACCGSQGE